MDNELQHWGILGMKWGVRRYQNSDGSWTEDGLKRRSKNGSANIKETVKMLNKKSKEAAKLYDKTAPYLNREYNYFYALEDAKRNNQTELVKQLEKEWKEYRRSMQSDYEKNEEQYKQVLKEVNDTIQELRDQDFHIIQKLSFQPSINGEPFGGISQKYKAQKHEVSDLQRNLGWEEISRKKTDFIEKDNNVINIQNYKKDNGSKDFKTSNDVNDEDYTWKDRIRRDKTQLYEKAVNNGSYNLEFLKMVPDSTLGDKNKLLKEYGEFVNDPDEWMENNLQSR